MLRLIAVFSILASPVAAESFSEPKAKAYCAPKTGTDNWELMKCVDAQQDAYRRFVRVSTSTIGNNALMDPAYLYCERRWLPDWELVSTCADLQFEAGSRLVRVIGGARPTDPPSDATGQAFSDCYRRFAPSLTNVDACLSGARFRQP